MAILGLMGMGMGLEAFADDIEAAVEEAVTDVLQVFRQGGSKSPRYKKYKDYEECIIWLKLTSINNENIIQPDKHIIKRTIENNMYTKVKDINIIPIDEHNIEIKIEAIRIKKCD